MMCRLVKRRSVAAKMLVGPSSTFFDPHSRSVRIIASTPVCDLPRGACVAFANTGERVSEQVHGRPLIDRPVGAAHRFSRTNNTGHRLAVPADYAGAAAQGHEIIAAVFEVSGAASPAVVEFTGRMARAHATSSLAGASSGSQ